VKGGFLNLIFDVIFMSEDSLNEVSQKAAELKEKGNLAFQKGDFDEAIKYFTQAIEFDPKNHLLYSNRSAAYASVKNYPRALEDANKTIELAPNWVKGYSRKGIALYYLERYQEALEAYKEGLKLDPNNSACNTGMQQVLLALKGDKIKKGVWGMMIAPFSPQPPHAIDWALLDKIVDWLINKNCAGIFALSPASEMFTLSDDERLNLTRAVVKRVNGRIPVIACAAFGGTTADNIQSMNKMAATGVDGIVIPISAIINQHEGDKEFVRNMEEILKATEDTVTLPIGLYECPEPYHKTLSPQTLAWVSSQSRITFYIDTCASVQLIKKKMEAIGYNPTFKYFNGNATTLFDTMKSGAAGYIGPASSFYPHLFAWFLEHFHKQSEEISMLQRFFSLADLTVRLHWPLNAKVYFHFSGEMEGLHGVTRIPQTPSFQVTEEDLLRIGHLKELVVYVWQGLTEPDAMKKKDRSTLL